MLAFNPAQLRQWVQGDTLSTLPAKPREVEDPHAAPDAATSGAGVLDSNPPASTQPAPAPAQSGAADAAGPTARPQPAGLGHKQGKRAARRGVADAAASLQRAVAD